VVRAAHPDDARAVRVLLTEDGETILARLSALHRDELRRMELPLGLPMWPDEPYRPSPGGSPDRTTLTFRRDIPAASPYASPAAHPETG
jgi:hypothetical protein